MYEASLEKVLEEINGRTGCTEFGEEQITLAPGEDMRDFLEKIVRSPRQPTQRRVKCAEILMAYKYSKQPTRLEVDGDFASKLDRAIRASGREREVRMIEARAITPEKGEGSG